MYYFVSDIHLGAGSPEQQRRTERAFCRWLDGIKEDASAIYLMGDIFDFWFEYRRVVPQGFTRVLGRLADMSDNGVKIHMFIGNHDMWCMDYLCRECGVELHFHPEVCDIAGRKLHLAHGDNMNIKGQPMLRLMNAFFHSSTARWLFRWLIHPDIALKFGNWWTRKSHAKSDVGVEHLNFLTEYARRHYASHSDTEAYIFGHMHLAHDHREGSLRVLYMSDWSADVAYYIAMDTDGNLELKNFSI